MKRKKRSSVRFARSLSESGRRKVATYRLAALVAAGTTHAMILPALGVDVSELAGEADVGGVPGMAGGASDADVGKSPLADVGKSPAADVGKGSAADVGEGSAVDLGEASVVDGDETMDANAGADSVLRVDAAADSGTVWEHDTAYDTDPDKNGAEFADELHAETENFAVTVYCNSNGETPYTTEQSDQSKTQDGLVEKGPKLILEEAEESSETYIEALDALAELRREGNESGTPDTAPGTEDLAVLQMQLEEIDPGDPIKINLRVRQMPEEISSEEFMQTAEIHKFQATGFQTTGFQTDAFRMEQGVPSADLITDLPENEPLSIVITWAAEEQEVSPASGEFISTAGTETEDTTAIGISEDCSESDMDSSETFTDTTDTQMAVEDGTTAVAMDNVTEHATDNGEDVAVERVTDDATNAAENSKAADKAGNSSSSEQPEPDYNGYELPATGGPGEKPYRVAGGLLSVAALIALQITGPEKSKERRHKKGSGFEYKDCLK